MEANTALGKKQKRDKKVNKDITSASDVKYPSSDNKHIGSRDHRL